MLTLQEYLECIEKLYKLKPENLDFKNNLEAARMQITSWIENKTKGKRSKTSFPQSSPSSSFRNNLPSVKCSDFKKYTWTVLANAYQDAEHVHHPEKFLHATADLVLSSEVSFVYSKFLNKCNTVYTFLCTAFFSFSILFLRSIQVFGCIYGLCLFIAEQNCMDEYTTVCPFSC